MACRWPSFRYDEEAMKGVQVAMLLLVLLVVAVMA